MLQLSGYTFIDLCSGTGAFNIILSKYGAKCVMSNDYDKSSEIINKANNLCENFIYGDINTIDINIIPNHNILTAGFPCQPFSIAGEKKGFDDERSNVFITILNILKEKNPEIVILENVKNLKTINNKNDFNFIISNLKNLNYYIIDLILNTSKITGIPHNRERLYLLCFKNENIYNKCDKSFLDISKNNIYNYLENDILNKYYYNEKSKIYVKLVDSVIKHINTNVIYQYRRTIVRENKNNVVPTLTANCGMGGHNVPILLDNNGIRKLTPRECFNLQGFDKNYILPTELCDSKLYKLAGNSITLTVFEIIIKKIIDAINL
jgi:DNA (cytosine-5)-methyltransferase 1